MAVPSIVATRAMQAKCPRGAQRFAHLRVCAILQMQSRVARVKQTRLLLICEVQLSSSCLPPSTPS